MNKTLVREINAKGEICFGKSSITEQTRFETPDLCEEGIQLDPDKILSNGWGCIVVPKHGRLEMESV